MLVFSCFCLVACPGGGGGGGGGCVSVGVLCMCVFAFFLGRVHLHLFAMLSPPCSSNNRRRKTRIYEFLICTHIIQCSRLHGRA